VAHFFFPFGVRLSTWVCLAAFLVLAGMRRDWRPLLACGAWLWGFEFTFQLASIAAGHHEVTPTQRLGYILLAPPIVLFASNWVRPDPRIFAAALITFGIWLSTGFHVNTTLIHFNVLGEVLNELSKTLWAVAYLIPLWSMRPASDRPTAEEPEARQQSRSRVRTPRRAF